jgi:hypothetical protein
MRFPAAMNGVYGIRSTKNSTNNTATHFGPFDVAGHFARDVDTFNQLGSVMYPNPAIKNYTKFPKRILFPQEYWENIDPDYATACNDYVKHLERFLGVSRTIIDTNSLWQRHSKQNMSLADYFANVSLQNPITSLSGFDVDALSLIKYLTQFHLAHSLRLGKQRFYSRFQEGLLREIRKLPVRCSGQVEQLLFGTPERHVGADGSLPAGRVPKVLPEVCLGAGRGNML